MDDARPGGVGARLYTGCREVVRADSPGEVAGAIDALDRLTAGGLYAGGLLAYEAGLALEPALAPLAANRGEGPLAWIGGFARMVPLSGAEVAALLPDPAGAWIGPARPMIPYSVYRRQFEAVHRHILAGDLYQMNLTFPAEVTVEGGALAAYAALRMRARAGFSALLWTGEEWLLSLSPELFFEIEGPMIRARPMKGTAPRLSDPAADRAAADALASDAKQRAENLMIVDLMRNDLSHVAEPGSVQVPGLFVVERYPGVHQMVSRIEARLTPGKTPGAVMRALFPCGSVTGAPKIAAMRAIAAIEPHPRGAYTGAIGVVAPGGDALFNVAIRTLSLKDGAGVARMGLGSGIVADSRPDSEYAECLDKAAFLTLGQPRFDLIETMAFTPADGIPLIERHLERMRTSARRLGFSFDRHAARNEIQAATFRLNQAARIRLLLAPGGALAIEVAPMPTAPAEPVGVAAVPLPVDSTDFRLAHKTTLRGFYDAARSDSVCFEVLFTRPDTRLTEGSFTNLFVPGADGVLRTPPLTDGLLPGVLRAELVETGRAVEASLTVADLAQGFYIGNALRGLIRAQLVAPGAARV